MYKFDETPVMPKGFSCASRNCGIKEEGDEHFCSQVCIEKHKRTSENIQHLKQRKKSGLPATMIKLIVILAVAYAAWTYKDKIKELFDKGKKEISK